ncbi:ABC transporter substrate-binding protein [Marinobacterium lutimaris]|uniref:ABC-type amino acid transport substrate-binding protein n=1 Tax=Marinobacterium lutimaris TaxID=568106 RepID=A0A1H5YEP1_9GAMM|nr:ABC transporter substrate-binding protein [Marinobacterium lutimaris]SEG22120.1 ABC-type amino acid transport substrate-binding protein [Marinobacterium lutimaris]
MNRIKLATGQSFLTLLLLMLALAPAQADDRLERIQSANQLRVCIWPDYFSISARHPKTGKLEGIDIELAADFARDLGVDLSFVETHFGRFMDDLEQDACDIGMFAIAITPARAERIDYSAPYLASHMYGVTTKTHPGLSRWEDMDQPGNVICVQRGTYMESFMKQTLRHAEVLVVTDPREREEAVLSGRADVFITDYPYSRKVLRFYEWARLIEPEDSNGPRPFKYAYVVAKNQPEWLGRVNRFVSQIKQDGRLEQAATNNDLLPAVVFAQDN